MTETIERGARIDNDTTSYVGANENVRPLRDHIVLEPLGWESSLEVAYSGKPIRGRVLAVGPGHYPKRYNGPKGRRTKMWDSKAFQPTDLKVGDVVELGGLEIGGFLHPTFTWGKRKVVLCREADVIGVRD